MNIGPPIMSRHAPILPYRAPGFARRSSKGEATRADVKGTRQLIFACANLNVP